MIISYDMESDPPRELKFFVKKPITLL